MEQALVILCGGSSTRMGTDKALLPFGEACLIEYLIQKYQPHFSRIYLSVKNKGDYSHLSLPVTEIPDLYAGAGPMSGVFSGLSMMDEEQAFFLPVDMPFLEPETGLKLLGALDGFDVSAIKETADPAELPAAAYSKSCIRSIGRCMLMHQFTFDKLSEKCRVTYRTVEEVTEEAKTPPDIQFFHLDTRTDYYKALRYLGCI